MHPEPIFSVVIPTFNRAERLRATLDAWDRQAHGHPPFEVIVVDDGSTDDTSRVIETVSPDTYPLVSLRQPNAGPGAARNLGLTRARGSLVLFTGDDIEPSPRLLARHLESHDHHRDPKVAVLGRVSWSPQLAITSTMVHVDGVGAQQFGYHYMVDGHEYDFRHFYTSNISIRRALLDREPGGFSRSFPAAAFEDAELGYRLTFHGLRIVYNARAEAFHDHPYDARAFCRRQVRCGEMAVLIQQRWPAAGRFLNLERIRLTPPLLMMSREGWRLVAGDSTRFQEEVEEDAKALACALDRPTRSEADPLLRALFEYATISGSARALFGVEWGARVASWWFLRLVPAAVRRLPVEVRDMTAVTRDRSDRLGRLGTSPGELSGL